jgi:hypothetical protein
MVVMHLFHLKRPCLVKDQPKPMLLKSVGAGFPAGPNDASRALK